VNYFSNYLAKVTKIQDLLPTLNHCKELYGEKALSKVQEVLRERIKHFKNERA